MSASVNQCQQIRNDGIICLRLGKYAPLSIQEGWDNTNPKLGRDNIKKKFLVNQLIFSLSVTVETLETRCDELQKHLEEAETRMRDRKEKRRSFLLIQDQENCSVR